MPNTADHRAEMHRLATQRRDAGKPIWDRRINLRDVWRNQDMTFEERRDAVVRRLRSSGWMATHEDGDILHQLVEELAEAQDADEFDAPWDAIYDEADYDRVWIVTF
jgi:hypothetical protein